MKMWYNVKIRKYSYSKKRFFFIFYLWAQLFFYFTSLCFFIRPKLHFKIFSVSKLLLKQEAETKPDLMWLSKNFTPSCCPHSFQLYHFYLITTHFRACSLLIAHYSVTLFFFFWQLNTKRGWDRGSRQRRMLVHCHQQRENTDLQNKLFSFIMYFLVFVK